MMRLLYPLIASALITIAPFLLTFEKGQNIVRGLFGYSEFALLLLFAFVKSHFNVFERAPRDVLRSLRPRASREFFMAVVPVLLLVAIFALMLVVAWVDLQNLLAIKGWVTGWYGVVPFVTCAFAVVMLWKTRGFSLPAVSFILFVSLVAHLAAYNYYAAQPLAQFPVVDYLTRTAPKPVERKNLPRDFAARYEAAIKAAGIDVVKNDVENAAESSADFDAANTGIVEKDVVIGNATIAVSDSPSVTHDFVDTARSNVVVLVESWGIPMDPSRFAAELAVFKGIPLQVGVHHRMYSRTRTAEREDLMDFLRKDSSGRRDTVFLPSEFAERGFATTFLFGGDSAEQWRYKYIRNIGFQNVVWGVESLNAESGTTSAVDLGGVQSGTTSAAVSVDVGSVKKESGDTQSGTAPALADSVMLAKIDSMLAHAERPNFPESDKLFIAFTTHDTKFPLPGFKDPYSGAADAVDSAYTVRLMGSLHLVADLARKYPNVRFIVLGDHDPILSPLAFQERFYKRWTPYVVLN